MRKFDDLLIFVAVVERQSFVGAARQLDLPPGSVSRKIQELEARLGITLLNRTTRRVAVTETGREVYEAAARGFAAIEEAESLARAHHDTPSGVLRVVAPYGFVHLVLMPLIPEFRALYPEVRLELVTTNQPIDLVENNCDIAVRVGAQPDSSYVIRPLRSISYCLVATPQYLARHGALKHPSELSARSMAGMISPGGSVSAPSPVPITYVFEKDGEREEIAFAFAVAATEPTILFDFALEHAGIAIVLEGIAQRYLDDSQLALVLDDWRIAEQMDLSILYRRRATMDSKVRVFLDFLLRHLRPAD